MRNASDAAEAAALLRTVRATEADGLEIYACVFETITSVPAARFPFETITQLCREKRILSVIDGAHGVGQIPIDLASLDPDFFVSNCHKLSAALSLTFLLRILGFAFASGRALGLRRRLFAPRADMRTMDWAEHGKCVVLLLQWRLVIIQ